MDMEADDLGFVDEDMSWVNFFDDLSQFENPLPQQESPPAVAASSDSVSSWIGEIENLLMNDNENDVAPEAPPDCEKFLAEILVEPQGEVVDAAEVERDSNSSDKDTIVDVDLEKPKLDASADDPMSKKRTRQMRNRDAAVKSRERRKMYVKNLEMKSRYLEGECRRLGHLLNCCYAENHALRLCLQSGSQFGASMTKLESAVLLLESLLLVSLLWFMGIMCQLSLSLVSRLTLEVVPPENVEQKGLRRVGLKGVASENSVCFAVQSFVMSRRCRASRGRMKMNYFVL